MPKTLLAIGPWKQWSQVVPMVVENGWRILHIPMFEDLSHILQQTSVDLVAILIDSFAREWERAPKSLWPFCYKAPLLVFAAGQHREALLRFLIPDSPPGGPLSSIERDTFRQSHLGRGLTLLEPSTPLMSSGIQATLRFIEIHYADPITLDAAARAAFYSRCHFCRIFKEQTGMSFVAYLAEVRIRHAADLLQYSKMSVTDIAFAVGFNNLAHFERVFRSLRRLTPSQYRKSTKDQSQTGQYLHSFADESM